MLSCKIKLNNLLFHLDYGQLEPAISTSRLFFFLLIKIRFCFLASIEFIRFFLKNPREKLLFFSLCKFSTGGFSKNTKRQEVYSCLQLNSPTFSSWPQLYYGLGISIFHWTQVFLFILVFFLGIQLQSVLLSPSCSSILYRNEDTITIIYKTIHL